MAVSLEYKKDKNMKKTTDTRVEMPVIFKHLIFSSLGVGGVMLVINGDAESHFTDGIIACFLTLFSGLATYGLFSILAILKKGGNFKDVINSFIDNIDIIYKDDSRN